MRLSFTSLATFTLALFIAGSSFGQTRLPQPPQPPQPPYDPGPQEGASFFEGFETGLPATPVPHGPPGATLTLASGQWFALNNSQPLGTSGVFQQGGAGAPFPAHSAPFYAAMNFNNGSGLATISTWLMTPVLTLTNGDTFSFFTRTTTPGATVFPDRLQLRMSTAGASTNTGGTATSTGDFSTLLLEINPNLTPTGYPSTFTQFTATISGLSGPTSGRIAFRYFVTGSGPSGLNGDFIGIDSVTYTNVPEPTALAAVVGGMGLMLVRRRRA